ncbi:class I SAM-dependent methyltransferase [Candidatus Bathyarchaeota archaeon]|nr:MAG: class I SAM-dependent methyltransferase [Candidatus Bathyarchaeota archaeon]
MGKMKIKENIGKITTPLDIALYMVNKLFRNRTPNSTSRILDAGCGSGVFIRAILNWCSRENVELPEIIGVEIDSELVSITRKKFKGVDKVKIIQADFLTINEKELAGKFDYIISNPPYISYERIQFKKRDLYKKMFKTAIGRFDTYMLFFEKALELLKIGGRMVFITPEKYVYTVSAKKLRELLAQYDVEEIELIYEDVFQGIIAYPTITVINKKPPGITTIRLRDGMTIKIKLPGDGSPWLARAQICRSSKASTLSKYTHRLKDIAMRISAGVATGCDEVFVIPKRSLPEELKTYAYPTISGKELSMFKPGEAIDYNKLNYVMLIPYDREGKLLSERSKPLIKYLLRWRHALEDRYIVKSGKKKWYAFHEKPPLKDILRPKILWCDIAREPTFYVDPKGMLVPRHTVYYLIPKHPNIIPKLVKYLNSDEVREWLRVHCQRAANGYLRLQSHILKKLPIPRFLLRYPYTLDTEV